MLAAAVMFRASLLGGVAPVRVVRTHLVQTAITTARLRAQDVLTLATAGDVPSKLSFPVEENAATQVLEEGERVIAGTENVEGDAAIRRLRPEPGESDSEVAEETDATLRRSLMIGLPLLVLLAGVTTLFLVGRASRPVTRSPSSRSR